MRMFVMFDLPTETLEDKRNYRRFRKYLITNGYIMFQFSIYTKIILNHSAMNQHKTKLLKKLPPKGKVDIMLVTEKQFAAIDSIGNDFVSSNPLSKLERLIEL